MKTIKQIFYGIAFFTTLSFLTCTRSKNIENPGLVGKWIMTVTENNQEESIKKADTTFNSLFNGLKYIPDNSEWYFINDSILIVGKINDSFYISDTVIYNLNDSDDSLLIISNKIKEKYKFQKVNANQIKIEFGDATVNYFLTKNSVSGKSGNL